MWKNNDTNTLTDLSENINSPFSSTKPDYKKFSTGFLTEMASEVVRTLNETYNKRGAGLHIEIRGTQEDYLVLKNVIEKDFSARHMDCIWSGHMQLPDEIMPKNIYEDLKRALSKYGKNIELNDLNDERGWLRFGFNCEKTVDEKELISLCAEAGAYLEKVTSEIEDEANRCAKELSRLEREVERLSLQKEEDGPEKKEQIDPDQLSRIMKRICRKYTREIGREFDKLLQGSVEEKYLDENRITKLVRDVEDYVDIHQVEWRESSSGGELAVRNLDEESRRKCILKILAEDLNQDIIQYIEEINSTGILFGNKSIEELKKKFLKEISLAKEFTEEQKKEIRERAFVGEDINVPYWICKPEEQPIKNSLRWKRKTFVEKDVCSEYRKNLRKELKEKRNALLEKNSKVFEKWCDEVFKMWKDQDAGEQRKKEQNEEQTGEKLKSYQKQKREQDSLRHVFQEKRKAIEDMLSF